MQINPYVHFDGDCAEAFKFYAELLGGEIETMMPFRGSPMPDNMPAEWEDKVMHAAIKAPDGFSLLGTDAPPAYFKTPQGFSVALTVDDPADAERIYKGLVDRAQAVGMELQKTFFAEKFAMLTDRFGIPWVINCPAAT